MSRYRRVRLEGGVYFFTVNLADRSSCLLVDQIECLREAYRTVQQRRPFETVAACVLPDWPHSSFHRYVQHGLLPAGWGGDVTEMQGSFGERPRRKHTTASVW